MNILLPRSTPSRLSTGFLLVLLSVSASAQDWNKPADGDWFNPGNWSTNAVPTSSTDATINNGGSAAASAATAPGPIDVGVLTIGADGGTGTLTVDGVNLEAQAPFQVGFLRPDYLGADAATGTLTLENSDVVQPFPSAFDPITDWTNIGVAFAAGEARGHLQAEDGAASFGLGLRVGSIVSDQPDSVARAEGSLTLRSLTFPSGDPFLEIARVDRTPDGRGGTSTASATVHLEDLALLLGLRVGTLAIQETPDVDATVEATVVFKDVALGGRSLEFLDVVFLGNQAGGRVQASVDAVLEDSSLTSSGIIFGDCNAGVRDAQILPSRVEVTAASSSFDTGFVDIAAVDVSGNGTADCAASLNFFESTLTGSLSSGIDVADVLARDEGAGTADAELVLTESELEARALRIAEGRIEDDAVAILNGRVELIDSTAEVSDETRVGAWAGDSVAAGSSITARLRLERSVLDTALLDVGSENPAGNPLDAEVSLNPSYLRTDDLRLGPDSRILLSVEGPARANASNLDQSGLYAAIDADAATLEGEVIVSIDYPAQTGATFDVITAAAGALSGSTATFSVVSPLDGAAQIGVMTEGGRDVLRVSISSAFAPPTPPGGPVDPPDAVPTNPPVEVPVNPPLALAILAALLVLLAAATIGRRREAP